MKVSNQAGRTTLRKSQIYLLAFSSAVITANLYYSQPLLAYWARTFEVNESNAGQAFFFSMLGQALGLIFLIPLGDKLKKKKFLLWTMALSIAAVALAAAATNIVMLKVAMLLAGFFSVGPQLIIPLAVDLSAGEERTHIVGMITAGILTGTVVARLVSGGITAWIGWRPVYILSIFFLLLSFILIQRFIPEAKSNFKGSYGKILRSTWKFFRKYNDVRLAVIVSASSFVVSRMFWATLAFLLAGGPFHLNTDIIGVIGLVTLAGAVSAPLAGKLSRYFTTNKIVLFGLILLLSSFVILFFFSSALVMIMVGGALMEGSRQLVQVNMQSRAIGLMEEARSRLNMLYISGCFIGAALGAALGLLAWDWNKWQGVCYVAFVMLAFQSVVFLLSLRKR